MDDIISQNFAPNAQTNPDDVKRMKKALNRLGYYMPYAKAGISGVADKGVFDALKAFQKDKDLAVTGMAQPGDATMQVLGASAENQSGERRRQGARRTCAV